MSEPIAQVTAPGGSELTLHRRADGFVIRMDGRELMTSHAHGSEEEVARLACEIVADRGSPRVLVAGLGMGYTLAAALAALPRQAEVVVVELLHAVIEWNRGPLAPLANRPLDDPRVTVQTGDAFREIARRGGDCDAVILDVDNGPSDLALPCNHRLYTADGLARIRRALRPGGVLAVWSAQEEPALLKRLEGVGFRVRRHECTARGVPGDPLHHVILGTLGDPRTSE